MQVIRQQVTNSGSDFIMDSLIVLFFIDCILTHKVHKAVYVAEHMGEKMVPCAKRDFRFFFFFKKRHKGDTTKQPLENMLC